MHCNTHTHTAILRPSGILSGTTRVSCHQKGKNQEGKNQSGFTGARDSEWQWHQLGHMQICTLTQTHNHASIPPLSFLQAGCPSCHPTNSIKALKAPMHCKTANKYVKTEKLILYLTVFVVQFYPGWVLPKLIIRIRFTVILLLQFDLTTECFVRHRINMVNSHSALWSTN